MIQSALALFNGASLIVKAAAIGAVLLSLVGAYGIWHHQIYERGYDRAIADIAANNKKAVGRAKQLRGASDSCNDSNGTWDATNGTCSR